jgi:hypothetical protein
MITIVSPIYLGNESRLGYHKTFLSCCKNLRDFDKINFVFFYEKSILDMSIVDDLKKYENVDLHINTYDFKTYLNQYNCLNYCFEHLGLERVIYLEDDVEISNDIYDLTNFYINSDQYQDKNILCYLNKDNIVETIPTRSDLIEVKRNFKRLDMQDMDYFTPWGFLATKHLWDRYLKYWDKSTSFDWLVVKNCKDSYNIVTPQESRVNHIGVCGMNYNEEMFKYHNFAAYKVKQYSDVINYSYV